jgi:hypothetical protein
MLNFLFILFINWRESYSDKDLCCTRSFTPHLARRRGNVHKLSRPNSFSRAEHSTMH